MKNNPTIVENIIHASRHAFKHPGVARLSGES